MKNIYFVLAACLFFASACKKEIATKCTTCRPVTTDYCIACAVFGQEQEFCASTLGSVSAVENAAAAAGFIPGAQCQAAVQKPLTTIPADEKFCYNEDDNGRTASLAATRSFEADGYTCTEE